MTAFNAIEIGLASAFIRCAGLLSTDVVNRCFHKNCRKLTAIRKPPGRRLER